MKKLILLFLLGILILSGIMVIEEFLFRPGEIIYEENNAKNLVIPSSNIIGLDIDSNGKIDLLNLTINNVGVNTAILVGIDFSNMNKSWIVQQKSFPLEILAGTSVIVSFIPNSDLDQINIAEFVIEFLFRDFPQNTLYPSISSKDIDFINSTLNLKTDLNIFFTTSRLITEGRIIGIILGVFIGFTPFIVYLFKKSA